jgi:hypothetical protein
VKRCDLIKKLEEAGCRLTRHGGNHVGTQTQDPNKANQCLDTKEIIENLAKSIIKKLS